MTSDEMARDYLCRARARREALETLFAAASYPDVVRESQDIAELVLKGDSAIERALATLASGRTALLDVFVTP